MEKNGAPANASTEGASYVKVQDHVNEVVKITYKWKYQDDSGTVQTLETTQEIKEGTNYTYNNSNSWKSSTAIQPSNHKPDFTYDGNSVSWTKTAPSWSYASGSYNGYTDWYAVCDNSKYSEDSKWTYGSLRDAIHYCSNKGSVNSQLASLIQVYLPAAMVVTADKEFDGRTFNGMSELEFTFNGTDLDWLSSNSANYGYGIHMYQARTHGLQRQEMMIRQPQEYSIKHPDQKIQTDI